MDNGSRKATDVLLDLENKINLILEICKNQDLNLKLLSNKINNINSKLSENENVFSSSKNESKQEYNQELNHEMIDSQFSLKIEESPQGFRRTSRPETFLDEKKLDKKIENKNLKKQNHHTEDVQDIIFNPPVKKDNSLQEQNYGSVPIVQRVLDKNGKSIFLADVEVKNNTGQTVLKTRTNGVGKWIGSLNPGTYKVIIKKRESVSKQQMEYIKEVNITESQEPINLENAIVK